ncbi:hypothetical protein RHMOL_Rhmol09G0054500 [Rhododendron molle]|uniref:Uncharacterized protein n=1 Tax=Rhododendron molle TaxID=49168 RepID=A0ACC0MBA6_RHOML|nr:hypothetical protein RHMOL_Rhmol09G0054500 [Rhododendron molle]
MAPTHACIYSVDKEPPKSSSDILQYPSASFGVNKGRLPWQMSRVSSGHKWRPLVQSFTSEIGEKIVIHEWIVRQYYVSLSDCRNTPPVNIVNPLPLHGRTRLLRNHVNPCVSLCCVCLCLLGLTLI